MTPFAIQTLVAFACFVLLLKEEFPEHHRIGFLAFTSLCAQLAPLLNRLPTDLFGPAPDVRQTVKTLLAVQW